MKSAPRHRRRNASVTLTWRKDECVPLQRVCLCTNVRHQTYEKNRIGFSLITEQIHPGGVWNLLHLSLEVIRFPQHKEDRVILLFKFRHETRNRGPIPCPSSHEVGCGKHLTADFGVIRPRCDQTKRWESCRWTCRHSALVRSQSVSW